MAKEQGKGFYVRFLGGFFLEFEGKRIIIAQNLKQKRTQILMILLKAGQEGISREKLIEKLEWEGDDWDKKLNNLRFQTCKLRKLLWEAGFPEGKYICASKGKYYFSLDYPVESDTGKIDQLYKKARSQPEKEKRESCFWQICELYQGEFLPSLMAEEWAVAESAYYQSIYSRCLEELCQILKRRKDYDELLKLVSKASQIHPYDEWQTLQVECLMAKRQYRDALQVYKKANKIFTEEFGIQLFQDKLKEPDSREEWPGQASEVIDKVRGRISEEGKPDGAYQCSCPNFTYVFRYLMRIAEEGCIRLRLLLCTLRVAGEGGPEKMPLPSQMEQFGKLLAKSVRNNDVYTQYSLNQFLVLLISLEEEQEGDITVRLCQKWKEFEEKERLSIEIELQKLDTLTRKEVTRYGK